MWPGGDMTGFWIMSLISGLVSLVITVGFVVLIILGIRWFLRQERMAPPPGTPGKEGPLEILNRRYANGEIDDEEYERRRRILSGG